MIKCKKLAKGWSFMAKTTIYDVAGAAKVSLATVSRVMNNPEKVNKETRDKVLRIIKELGYKIKLDSNGCNSSLIKEAVSKGLVDFIAMDIKNSKAKYPQTIGLKNFDLAPIEESVSFLLSNRIPYEFRTTLIDEFHTEEDILEIKQWIKGANRYFLQCYIDSENCIEHGFHPVSFEKAKHFVALLENSFGKVALRGYEDPHEAK